jgi:serine/threonine protein kinase
MSFEQCALASGLLTQQQIDEARAGIRWSDGTEIDPLAPPSDEQLANRLVETHRLNAWQAKQLLDGRTKFNLGPYRIVNSIGQGGMGQVFKAEHEITGGVVAVKVLPRDKSTPEAIINFTHEIQALSSLHHPKLVSALDAGEDGNVHYLVTEYVPGTDLRKLVRRDGPLSMAAAASIIRQVAEGLEYAHGQGIVHRDVKPGNVLVASDGEAKLSDLGLAGPLAGEPETDPRYGKIVGTADYLSPDHIRNPWYPAPAWDIYSLGCTLYYAVTGKVPFPGGTTADKARAHGELRPLDPRRLNPNLSSEFVEVMADMMAKDPVLRIASAREVIARLEPFLSIQTGTPTTETSRESPWSSMSITPPAVPPPLDFKPFPPGSTLADTITDFPNISIGASGDDNSGGSSEDGFDRFVRIEEDQPRSLEIPIPAHEDLMAVIWPLTVFILAPLALIGAVWLLSYLMHSLLW